MVGEANATLVQFATDIASCASSIMDIFSSVLSIFMQPPIVYFLGIGVVVAMVGVARRLIKKH
ncbi:MAG: hypothetical protein ACM3RX_00930 [Methanococcaceae archaeon]